MKEKLVITKLRKSMIHVRGGFSDEHNMGSCNTQMQYTELDDRTRTLLFNYVSEKLDKDLKRRDSGSSKYQEEDRLCRNVLGIGLSFKMDVDKHYGSQDLIKVIDNVFFKAPYNEVFDLLKLLIFFHYDEYQKSAKKDFCDTINAIFEKEFVGYRVIEGRIVSITDKNEISAIEEACENKFEGTRAHISKALGFISDREHPDYKNSVKESISAVESVCSIIVGDESASLGKALKRLKDNGVNIHPTLEVAFSKLYGYTSDEGGIRHAEGMTESEVTFEDAKFMLVSCSAFVNYLTANYGKIGGEK